MATRIHPKNVHEKSPKNVHEMSPKKRTSRGQKCPRNVTKSVHEMSPLLSTRCHLLCPRDVCHPYQTPMCATCMMMKHFTHLCCSIFTPFLHSTSYYVVVCSAYKLSFRLDLISSISSDIYVHFKLEALYVTYYVPCGPTMISRIIKYTFS